MTIDEADDLILKERDTPGSHPSEDVLRALVVLQAEKSEAMKAEVAAFTPH